LDIREHLLIFHSAGRVFALPISAVRELLPMALLASPPGLPAVLAGFLNLRGVAVPIVRLDRLFGLPECNPGLYSALIILQAEVATGLLVDGIQEVASPDDLSYLPLLKTQLFNDCAEAELEVNGAQVYLLSPQHLLLEQERQSLAEFQGMAQRRLRELEVAVT
jgi:purine-binding chemotaxis protein CheW